MLENTSQMRFSFSSKSPALTEDTFAVVSFTGREGLSEPYQFTIQLVSTNGDIDLDSVVQRKATFTVHRKDGEDVPYHGIVIEFTLEREFNGYYFYEAVLVPKFWWLQLTHHNQVFLDKDVKGILEKVLKDGGLTSKDFDIRLQGNHDTFPYICQYNETHFNFVHRWIEREGIYYYFEQGDSEEKLILTDTKIAHVDMPQGGTITYLPPSGLDTLHRDEVVKQFTWRRDMTPAKVQLVEYNYEKPDDLLIQEASVDDHGLGEIITYGEHYKTPDSGKRLAKIRAECYQCRKNTYHAASTVPFIRPGFTFTLAKHNRDNLNRKYLTIRMEMSGDQAGYLIAGIKQGLSEHEKNPYYKNVFHAIESDLQFRTECKTPKPKIQGVIEAKIDAAGSGQYAELDEQGRYKIVMPFDLSGRSDGKASCYIRMAQPYTGSNHGMHFPLHKGTEVLVTFTDGDPDRPIIAGAVNNPSTPSQVKGENQTKSVIQTGNQTQMHFEDKEGSERIQMHVPAKKSFVRMGAPNDPPPPASEGGETAAPYWTLVDTDGFKMTAGLNLNVYAGLSNEIILGNNFMGCVGFEQKIITNGELGVLIGGKYSLGITSSYLSPHTMNLKGVEKHITQMENKINDLKTKVAETEEKVAAARQSVVGVKDKIADTKELVNGQRDKIVAAKQEMSETKDSLAGTVEEIQQLMSKISDEELKVIENVSLARGLKDSTAEMKEQIKTMRVQADAIKQETFECGFDNYVTNMETAALFERD